jgi:hypothetical protein
MTEGSVYCFEFRANILFATKTPRHEITQTVISMIINSLCNIVSWCLGGVIKNFVFSEGTQFLIFNF